MFDGLLKSKFYTKCKSDIKLTKARIEMIKKKRSAMQKYLRNDVADLLRNGLDMNAYSRVEGLLVEINRSECYDFIDQYCTLVTNHLMSMSKQRECPEECRESISSLMSAAARVADLPELRELRVLFAERYGNSLDCFANKEFDEKLKCGVPSKDKKLQLLQEIAVESALTWNSKALANKLRSSQVNEKDFAKAAIDSELKTEKERISPEEKKKKTITSYRQNEVTKLEDNTPQERGNVSDHGIPRVKDIRVDTITSSRNQDRRSLAVDCPKEEEKPEQKPRKYGLIPPPPYTKSEPEKANKALEQEKTKPEAKSVRRRHPAKLHVACNDNGKGEKQPNEANREQAAQAQRILKFFERGGNNSHVDDEERAMDKLLRHYSRKTVGSDSVPKMHYEKNDYRSKMGPNGSDNVETNGKEGGPSRLFSLPSEVSSPSETSKRHVRASSFQQEMLSGSNNNNHVHPKLPDYDHFVAALAEFRREVN